MPGGRYMSDEENSKQTKTATTKVIISEGGGSWHRASRDTEAPGFAPRQIVRSVDTDDAFEIIDRIDGGLGLGTVYLARDPGSGFPVALKTFQPRLYSGGDDRARFEREALIWIGLPYHPNVVAAYSVLQVEGTPILLLEHVAGGSLWKEMEKSGSIPLDRTLDLALQFCDGMAHAHAHGMKAHCDIKPENVLLTPDRKTLKITDFNVARGTSGVAIDAARSTYGAASSQAGEGTPPYMAPEQCKSGGEIDSRTDIYGFGVMLWEMLTGELPEKGPLAGEKIAGSHRRDDLPDALVKLIQRCVDHDRLQRPPNFHVLGKELAKVARRPDWQSSAPSKDSDIAEFGYWNDKGNALSRMRRFPEALDCFARALTLASESHHAWNNKGITLMRLNRPPEALECFEKALRLDGGFILAANNKAAALNRLKRYREALESCARALDGNPAFAGALNNKGNALFGLGQYNQAIEAYKRALINDGRNSDALASMASALIQTGRDAEAFACCDRALAVNSRHLIAHNNRASALNGLQRFSEALETCKEAISIDSGIADVWVNKSTAHGGLREFDEAIECCNCALALEPRHVVGLVNKGNALACNGQFQEAIGCYERAQKIAPTDPMVSHNLNMLRSRLRQSR